MEFSQAQIKYTQALECYQPKLFQRRFNIKILYQLISKAIAINRGNCTNFAGVLTQ